jgi:hypothetical protein
VSDEQIAEMNFNESVRVRLTDEGRRILAERHDELRLRVPGVGPHIPKAEDEEGLVSFQLWDLMHVFGPFMFLGNPRLPIEADIRFRLRSRQSPTSKETPCVKNSPSCGSQSEPHSAQSSQPSPFASPAEVSPADRDSTP